MKGIFRRGLSDAIHQDLLGGPCSTILRACLDAGLYVCLRDNYLNAYYRGRSLAKIAGRSRQPPELKINHKYLIADRIGDYTGRRSGDYRAFDVDTAFAEFYAVHLGSMIHARSRIRAAGRRCGIDVARAQRQHGRRVLFRSTDSGAGNPEKARRDGLSRRRHDGDSGD